MPCHLHLINGSNQALQAYLCDSEMIKPNENEIRVDF